MEREWIFGNIRVQVLTEEIVRVEVKNKACFEDRNTFFVPARHKFAGVPCVCGENQTHHVVKVGAWEVQVPKKQNGLWGVKVINDQGKEIYRYQKTKNTGELPALSKTPRVYAVVDNPRIFIPDGGYTYRGDIENSGYQIEENAEDIYLLLCNKDAKKLRKLYVAVTGKSDMVRLGTLGLWNSRYYVWKQQEAAEMLCAYQQHDVPLDNMVIDVDWRIRATEDVTYDVNTELFPDLKAFFAFAHERDVEIMFNDHPVSMQGAHVFAPHEVQYREENLKAFLEMGLDYWWYDRNWHTAIKTPTAGVNFETLGAYLFHDVTRQVFEKNKKSGEFARRPVAMSNTDNIQHGMYGEVRNSAAHRYPFQWTGDIYSDTRSLQNEVESMLLGGNNCVPYLHSDCCGHLGDPDDGLYLRWIQYGAFSPIMRPHGACFVKRFREPWLYEKHTLDVAREYIRLRYRLMPLLYAGARGAYENGTPVFKALGWEYPNDKRALMNKKEYMLGSHLLICPVFGRRVKKVEPRRFIEPVKATYFLGHHCQGEPIYSSVDDRIDHYWNMTSPNKNVPIFDFSGRYETKIFFDEDVNLMIYVDDGATVWIDGVQVFEDREMKAGRHLDVGIVEGGKPHDLKIEYFQAGGHACFSLRYQTLRPEEEYCDDVYLPAGEWLHLFNGKTYAGNKTHRIEYGADDMPLFVKLGGAVPLLDHAQTTKQQRWDKPCFDLYPAKCSDENGELYEDDGETLAYQDGEFRKSRYHFNCQNGVHTFVLDAACGEFKGEKAFEQREITLRYHSLQGKVCDVKVNGNSVDFEVLEQNLGAFPFSVCGGAADSDVVVVRVNANVKEQVFVEFICKK